MSSCFSRPAFGSNANSRNLLEDGVYETGFVPLSEGVYYVFFQSLDWNAVQSVNAAHDSGGEALKSLVSLPQANFFQEVSHEINLSFIHVGDGDACFADRRLRYLRRCARRSLLQSGENKAQNYFTDTVLINQNGERMRFYTDLMKGKTVIIDTFFATCQASCLPMNRNLALIQEGLGDRLGKDVHILSISVDPTVDTPTLLNSYAKKLKARPGWYFLTGGKESVELILKKLGQFVEDKNGHTNIFLIGNDRTGLWKKAFGLAKSEELMKVVDSVMNDPGPAQNLDRINKISR